MLRVLDITQAEALIIRKGIRLAEAEQTVAPILEDVRKRGDEALLEYARRFDQFTGTSVRVTEAETESAASRITSDFAMAMETASANSGAASKRAS